MVNEGKGMMLKVALSYKNGTISENVLSDICKKNNWTYRKDKKFSVLIISSV